jgi:hypothetical protein
VRPRRVGTRRCCMPPHQWAFDEASRASSSTGAAPSSTGARAGRTGNLQSVHTAARLAAGFAERAQKESEFGWRCRANTALRILRTHASAGSGIIGRREKDSKVNIPLRCGAPTPPLARRFGAVVGM